MRNWKSSRRVRISPRQFVFRRHYPLRVGAIRSREENREIKFSGAIELIVINFQGEKFVNQNLKNKNILS